MPTDFHAAVSAVILADFLCAQLYLNMAAKRLGGSTVFVVCWHTWSYQN